MELWIRSQDREVLMQCNQVYYFENNKKHFIVSDLELVQRSYDYQPLGQYKTKERALEVLDEIQNLLKPQMVLSKVGKPIAETCDGTVYMEPNEYEIKELSTYVYEMPKD